MYCISLCSQHTIHNIYVGSGYIVTSLYYYIRVWLAVSVVMSAMRNESMKTLLEIPPTQRYTHINWKKKWIQQSGYFLSRLKMLKHASLCLREYWKWYFLVVSYFGYGSYKHPHHMPSQSWEIKNRQTQVNKVFS